MSGVLKRLDHSNIFLIIAGTYTPFALSLLPPDQARTLLLDRLGRRHRRGALPGLLGRRPALALHAALRRARLGRGLLLRPAAARRRPGRRSSSSAVGGLLYTLGAVVYGTKRPNPSPRWFGFHEIFHAFTVLAFVAHYVAVVARRCYGAGSALSAS